MRPSPVAATTAAAIAALLLGWALPLRRLAQRGCDACAEGGLPMTRPRLELLGGRVLGGASIGSADQRIGPP